MGTPWANCILVYDAAALWRCRSGVASSLWQVGGRSDDDSFIHVFITASALNRWDATSLTECLPSHPLKPTASWNAPDNPPRVDVEV